MGETICINNKITEKSTVRNIALDVLRIICMFLIVLGHSICHGQVLETITEYSANYFLINAMYTFLMVHVNCFVLISGYFLCTHEFSIKKAISLWVKAFFWSSLLYALLCVRGIIPFEVRGFIKALLPFTQQRYWFVTSYLLMYCLVPILNAAIKAMSKRQFAVFLTVFFLVYIVLQNLIFWREFTCVNSSNPLFFSFLYMVAAYIRLYPPKKTSVVFTVYIDMHVCNIMEVYD